MNWKKALLILAVSFIITISLAACGGGEDNSESAGSDENDGEEKLADEQILNVNIATEPPSLHPQKSTDTTSAAVLDQIFEGLTRVNQDGEAENAMASDIQLSDDKKTYTFTIREDATWSNGDPVTAKDFEYAWKWVLNPESTDTDFAYYLYPIKNAEAAKAGEVPLDEIGVTVKDDKTLVVELEQPTPYFLQSTAHFTFYPVNHHVAKANPEWASDAGEKYVTNGPFLLDSWQHKSEIVLKKNTNYWDAETVKLETIHMLMIEDLNTELQMYEKGELDWAGSPTGNIPQSAIPSLKQSGRLNISPLAGTYYIEFNTNQEPYNNVNIRKALALSINRQAIVENVSKGGEQPAMALVPTAIWEDNEEGYFQDNHVEKAKELLEKGLEEEGLDELPTLTFSYNTNESHAAIAQALQDMWRENLGLDVELHNQEWNVYLDSMSEGNYEMGRMGWLGTINDPSNFLNIFETAGGNNYTDWESEAYANLLEQARTETDEEARQEILGQAEQILMDEMPIAPIYFYTNVWMNKDYVKNINVSTLGGIQYKWGYITEH
ncbi:oligopeptide transport system substrate-binding protein [Lentibacillus halodurans]|uniref:Oligopeptide transport system substrate-binding protein n=1 Tax=Lentibacillus halodurans TaxID=237679 RepID=A0A1I1A5D1_9BACI|nr:peptide ABC transporter substrate-binding protein [Lentibacillus halodurans]SFB33169.1 oligopeptide transport system substrate-binding protein [Lentibacillus halodurans]